MHPRCGDRQPALYDRVFRRHRNVHSDAKERPDGVLEQDQTQAPEISPFDFCSRESVSHEEKETISTRRTSGTKEIHQASRTQLMDGWNIGSSARSCIRL